MITIRRSEVEEFLIDEFNSRNDKLMVSFDWDLKWIMGSSSLPTLRTQLATLILNCRKNDGTIDTVFFEMNRRKLNELIRMLEECEKKLETQGNSTAAVAVDTS